MVRLPAEQLERAARAHQRRVERLALDQAHADLAQLQVVLHVACARDDRELREVLEDEPGHLQALLDVVDREDEHARLRGARRAQQIQPRGVAVEHAPAEAAQGLDLIGVVVEHRRRNAVRIEHAGDDLPSSAKAAGSGEGVLAIPVSAVLDTGRRRITYRQTDDGAYELVELRLGPRAHSMDESGKRREFFVVLDGIDEGDRVVSQSGFLLDSQRQIEGMPSLLYPNGQAGTALHSGHGGMDMGGKGGAASKTDSKPATPAGHQH